MKMKRCIPIMAETIDETLSLINEYQNDYDIIEWRIDCLDKKMVFKDIISAFNRIRQITEKPIIITFRSKKEGGKKDISVSEYINLIRKIINNIKPVYIDIEKESCGSDAAVKMLCTMAKKREIKTIVSYHDMFYTAKSRDIEMLICKMKYLGADLPKVAYFANEHEDVENLIKGASAAHNTIGDLIAISMGELGVQTRTIGHEFGSIISFNKAQGKASIDNKIGQIELNEI